MKLTSTTDDSGADSVTWLLYGKAGSGKTSAVSTLPNPARVLYVNIEGGQLPAALVGAGARQARWDGDGDVRDFIREILRLMKGDGAALYDWVVYDSASRLAEDVFHLCKLDRRNYNRDGELDMRAVYGNMGNQMKTILRAMGAAPYNVILICKAASLELPDKSTLGVPAFPGKQLKEWVAHEVDGVFYLHCKTIGKGTAARQERHLQTGFDGFYEAKDRSSMLDHHERVDLGLLYSKIIKGLAPKEPTA